MKRTYITPLEYVFIPETKEPGEHMTMPSQAISVKELLRRHVSGTLENIAKTVMYEESEEYQEDPTQAPDFDLADVTNIVEESKLKRRKASEAAAVNELEAKRKAKEAKEHQKPGGAILDDETHDETQENK